MKETIKYGDLSKSLKVFVVLGWFVIIMYFGVFFFSFIKVMSGV